MAYPGTPPPALGGSGTEAGLRGIASEIATQFPFPGSMENLEIRQTHASIVFLTPTDVYKLKRAVNLGFLDYSTPRRRAFMCRREVELNRRLAPSVYLGMERLRRNSAGVLTLGRTGRVVDYLVHMRRLDDNLSLRALLATDRVGPQLHQLQRVARLIAAFHASAPLAPSGFGAPSALLRNTRDNVAEFDSEAGRRLSPRVKAAARERLLAFPRAHRDALLARISSGSIRDGHGDLRAEHIYLEHDATQVIDCIEFNRHFRLEDVALDFAFLVMDVATHHTPELADALVDAYESATGDSVRNLMPGYTAYRAVVRCRVALLRARESMHDVRQRNEALREAARYLYAALRLAIGDRVPNVILVAGLPGSGKTTLARALQSVVPARVLSTDVIRKQAVGLGPGVHRYEPDERGLYAPAVTRQVYSSLRQQAAEALTEGRSVILDATFGRRADRLALRQLASRVGARFLCVECAPEEAVIRQRFVQRERAGGDEWSDATFETYLAHRNSWEPFDELSPSEYLRVTTTSGEMAEINPILECLAASLLP